MGKAWVLSDILLATLTIAELSHDTKHKNIVIVSLETVAAQDA